jgi:lysophospholipase L1-like esterase
MNIARTKLLAVCIAAIILSVTLIVVFSGIGATRVACIGDSITQFSTYPNDLQTMLGTSYNVREFGVSGSTVLFSSFAPYIDQREFQRAKQFLPNIVIIMLGTNDAREDYYQSIANFVADYKQLIREVQALESKPKIFLVKPPPIFDNDLDLSNVNMLEGVLPGIGQVAEELNLTLIDVYTHLVSHPEYFSDGVHPNNEGAKVIASEVYKAI